MMYNNGNNYTMNMGGYGYANGNQQQPKIIMNQTLNKEEVNKLRSRGHRGFNLMITDEERLTQVCNHKDPYTNNFSLVDNGDGTVTCSICGERFSLLTDLSKEEASCIAEDYNDMVQTAKTFYGNIPTEAGRSLYQTFAFIKKMPEFYMIAKEYANKLDQNNPIIGQNHQGNSFGMYSMLMNPMANPGMGMGMGMNMNMNQAPMNMGQQYFGQPQSPVMGNPGMAPNMGMGNQVPNMGGMQAGMYQGNGNAAGNMAMNGNMNSGYFAGMPNPNGRPVGVVEPQSNQQVVNQTISAGPSPMAAAQSPTADVKKNFKA